VDTNSNPKRLPAATAAGSLFCIVALTALTNPVTNVALAMIFFLALITLLVSTGFLLVLLHKANVSPKSRYNIFILSLFITLILMFRSAGALGWLDGIALCLIALGLLFYGSRRVQT
jgi:hypothetical protein